MTQAAAWRWCLVAGVVAFACSVGFGLIPGMHACGHTDGVGPILAFETARAPTDVARLFGTEPCRSALAAAQRAGLWLDGLGFIPAYTAFLCLAASATGHRWRRAIVAVALAAALADEIEGALLFAILRAMPGTPALLDALFWPVRVKFVLLAAATLGVSYAVFQLRQAAPLGINVLGVLAGISIVLAMIGLGEGRPMAMMGHFTRSWVALLVFAGCAVFWPRLRERLLPLLDDLRA